MVHVLLHVDTFWLHVGSFLAPWLHVGNFLAPVGSFFVILLFPKRCLGNFRAIFEICEYSEALLGTLLGDFGSKWEPCEAFETAPGDDPARRRATPPDAARRRATP